MTTGSRRTRHYYLSCVGTPAIYFYRTGVGTLPISTRSVPHFAAVDGHHVVALAALASAIYRTEYSCRSRRASLLRRVNMGEVETLFAASYFIMRNINIGQEMP